MKIRTLALPLRIASLRFAPSTHLPVMLASVMLVVGLGAAPALTATVGPVTDDLGVVRIAKGNPIQIGGYWTISGPDTALGLDQQRGAELYFDTVDNRILGHPVKLIVEDSQCSAEGGQAAGTKFAANPDVVAVIGPDCSSAAVAAVPIMWNVGISSIGTSATSPALTAPDRKPGLAGYVRTAANDLAQGNGDADYFYNTLGCKALASIHDGSPYAEQIVRVAERRFKELGGKVVASEAIAPTDVDMRPVLTAIATAKPCVVYHPVFVAASAQITRQLRDIDGLRNVPHFGGGALMATGYVEAAGDAIVGARITFTDTSIEAHGADYPKFLKAYRAKYGEAPINAFHAQAFDAGHLLHEAVKMVAKTDKDGTTYIGRKALHESLFQVPAFDGLSGRIKCETNGDCGQFAFSVWEFTDKDPATFDIGKNPKKIYPKR